MKFADYVKMRMVGAQSAFRRNSTYVFFLLCIKERCQVRSMISIYFRKAFKRSDVDKKKLSTANLADIARSNATYSVFKSKYNVMIYIKVMNFLLSRLAWNSALLCCSKETCTEYGAITWYCVY